MKLISFAILVMAYTFFLFHSVTYKTSRIQNYFTEFCAFQVITRNPIKELRNDKNIPHLAFLSIQATWTPITKRSTIDFHFQSHNWRWNIVLIFFPLKRYCVLSVWISDISMHLLLLMQSRAEIEFLYFLWDIKYPHFPPFFIRNIFVGYKVSAPLPPTKTLHIERTTMVRFFFLNVKYDKKNC